MDIKQYVRNQMHIKGRWSRASLIFMGSAFFCRMVYYFGLIDLGACGAAQWIFRAVLPVLLCAAYLTLLGVMKMNAPGIYGILGASLCLALLISCFFAGGILRIMLGIIFYLASALLLLAAVGGFLPYRFPAPLVIGSVLVLRILFFDIGLHGLVPWVLELSELSILAALFCLPLSLKPSQVKRKT